MRTNASEQADLLDAIDVLTAERVELQAALVGAVATCDAARAEATLLRDANVLLQAAANDAEAAAAEALAAQRDAAAADRDALEERQVLLGVVLAQNPQLVVGVSVLLGVVLAATLRLFRNAVTSKKVPVATNASATAATPRDAGVSACTQTEPPSAATANASSGSGGGGGGGGGGQKGKANVSTGGSAQEEEKEAAAAADRERRDQERAREEVEREEREAEADEAKEAKEEEEERNARWDDARRVLRALHAQLRAQEDESQKLSMGLGEELQKMAEQLRLTAQLLSASEAHQAVRCFSGRKSCVRRPW